ncbi:hypothetical protein VV02_23440 [Luteipulveratus mongoliensis]|uniref:Peptidase M20 dimerisation domain-containing protein n=1 Tax=Luteipulveratus mongoliensis TaxID=571913 RepID=A0A0K1JR97_9MICO|nr:hypothetical protein VV02_23440 [Luteipulveratus mongoliensis]
MSALVRIPTVSHPDPGHQDDVAFARFVKTFEASYPLLHEHLDRTTVGPGGLLFHWAGDSAEKPLVLMAHWDVVPVVESDWSEDPFSGRVSATDVHGRGTLDDKGSLVVICEAVETLLAEGYSPEQDVYLSFGCDEEVAGTAAVEAVDELRSRGVTPWLVIDEGGAVVEGVFPGLRRPAALVGVAEKGLLDLEITTADQGGHAAMPRQGGAVARLARAIGRLDQHPFPVTLTDPALAMVETLGEHVRGPLRAVLSRAGSLRPALAQAFARMGPETAAVVRTTVAITRLEGSPAANVIAARATAHANIRIQLGETVESVVARLGDVIKDRTIELRVVSGSNPTSVSPSDGEQFDAIRSAVAVTYPDAVTAPYVMMQASDARHFHAISDHVYRFSPFAMTREQRDSIHGVDEYISLDALGRGVAFYRHLIAERP